MLRSHPDCSRFLIPPFSPILCTLGSVCQTQQMQSLGMKAEHDSSGALFVALWHTTKLKCIAHMIRLNTKFTVWENGCDSCLPGSRLEAHEVQ